MRTLEEAKSILGPDKALVAQIKDLIQQFLPTAEVLLFGSVARGSQQADSDYDVLVLTDVPLPKRVETAVEHAILDLELRREIVVSTLYYSRDEWDAPLTRVSPFRAELEREAIVL